MNVLARLLAVTPLPPLDADVDGLVAAFTAMDEARRAILAELPPFPPPASPADRALVLELVARQDAWQTALAAAKAQVCAQRVGVGKLRSYAR